MITNRQLDSEFLGAVAHLLKTISHPIRLEVISILERLEPVSVSKIQESLNVDVEQSLLSHHLVKMKDRGVIKSEKKGKVTNLTEAYCF